MFSATPDMYNRRLVYLIMLKNMTDNPGFKRVYWHSRRGMLELDLALVPFAEQVYPNLPEKDQEIYRKLLTCEDTELFAWVLQKEVPQDEELAYIMEKILAHAKGNTPSL